MVSETASQVQGTSAELKQGDQICVWDMLHGLMLPSGNDAAIALAEHFGTILLNAREEELRLEDERRAMQDGSSSNPLKQ